MLKITKIARRTRIHVKGHGYFEPGQEKELNELIDDHEKQLLSQRRRIEVSGALSKSKAKSDGAEASGDDNS